MRNDKPTCQCGGTMKRLLRLGRYECRRCGRQVDLEDVVGESPARRIVQRLVKKSGG